MSRDLSAVLVMVTFQDGSAHQFLITRREIEKNTPKKLGRLLLARLEGAEREATK